MNLRHFSRGLVALLCVFQIHTLHASERISPENLWTYDDDITVPTLLEPSDSTSESIYLPANIFVPTSSDPSAKFPAIIFISSWALNEHEYLSQAEILANKGYVVLSYTSRGFNGSPGMITTAGTQDFADAQAAIDYLLDSSNGYPVDENAIGLSGVSYGAGISLITGFQDPRVKAIVAMSGWADLVDSLWAGFTPNYAWIELLLFSSQPVPFLVKNNPSPEIEANYMNMKVHQNVEDTKVWGSVRSPITYLDQVNGRDQKPAVYIANNLHDYLFQPDGLFRMLNQYNGEWRLDLSRGVHASGEAGGLLGNEEHVIWLNAGLWFDHYLKGINNGIEKAKPFSTKVLNTGRRESYASLDAADETKLFNLIPESGAQGGSLSESYANSVDLDVSFSTLSHITYSGWITGALAHTGRTINVNEIDSNLGLVFKTDVLPAALRLRGEAKVSLPVVAHDKSQYFGYLFYLNPETGVANWVGHAPFSCHTSEGCATTDGAVENIVLDFYWTSVDIPAGSQLVLIIDGNDPDYWRYEATPETNTVAFRSGSQATLSLPVAAASAKYDDPVANYEADLSASRGLGGEGGYATSGVGGSSGPALLIVLMSLGLIRSRRPS